MQVTILTQEKNSAKVEIILPGQSLTKALDQGYETYLKSHEDAALDRAKLTESPEGQQLFRQAVQDVFSECYGEAVRQTGLQVASEPIISVKQAQEGEDLVFHMEFALRPEVKLGQYKGIHVTCPPVEPTEEEYQTALRQAETVNQVSKPVDGPAVLGDTATIDFTGFLDGTAFEGGAGTDYPLTLGSGAFIPGFEEQLVGAAAGQDVTVNVTFPESYPAKNLAGKATVFQVKVKKLERPERSPLTEEQKNQVREQARQQKRQQADMQIEDQVLGKILKEAQVEIPQAMLKSEVNICMQQFVAELSAQGTDLQTFMQRSGKTQEQMLREMEPLANRRIMLRLVLSAIAQEEGMTATEAEVEDYFAQMARQYGMDKEQIRAYAGDGAESQIRAEIVSAKAYALLRESTILDME